MTNKSKQAYANQQNAERRITHRQKCLNGLERETTGLTYLQLAAKIGLKPDQTWKRASDLHKDGLIMICGTTDTYSRYKLVREPGLFKPEKVPHLAKWLKENHFEIWQKYQILIKHEL
jgi:hypothetical protein